MGQNQVSFMDRSSLYSEGPFLEGSHTITANLSKIHLKVQLSNTNPDEWLRKTLGENGPHFLNTNP